jgi:hypothetical protein
LQQAARRPASRADCTPESSKAVNTAMTAIAVNNSTNVKAVRRRRGQTHFSPLKGRKKRPVPGPKNSIKGKPADGPRFNNAPAPSRQGNLAARQLASAAIIFGRLNFLEGRHIHNSIHYRKIVNHF